MHKVWVGIISYSEVISVQGLAGYQSFKGHLKYFIWSNYRVLYNIFDMFIVD